ncbi:mucin-2 isoform X1 [Microplitis mediator]|uniref:mucin-2 isoform X1 n=1 Tax=Microplitis mediator TaxID=375433 RepID=UPI00255351B3|nr:mucin-2 isoform X1 [Microplitis mediator]
MDVNASDRDCSALGGLFHQIITDMKNGAPLWDDLISKATKLHTCLKAAILAVSAYLEAFQKIADAATSARGATKEIGTALTRICLRHKAVETRMKSFTCAIMDRLVMPLQEKLEDWKKALIVLDKEHTKEYKKAKAELKKQRTSAVDTLRLKKKTRKAIANHGPGVGTMGVGGNISEAYQGNKLDGDDVELNRRLLEPSVADKRISLEETERKAVRAALLEERGRFCHLARLLKPVLDEEIAMLMELTHLQEVSEQLERHTLAPYDLPAQCEQIITDLKERGDSTQWPLHHHLTSTTPPSSPSLSLGSRKSSMCSISSLTSSGSSGSCKNHPSPACGHPWHRSFSQPLGVINNCRPVIIDSGGGYGSNVSKTLMLRRHLSTGSSRDSGFTSQDTLNRHPTEQVSSVSSQSNVNQNPNASTNINQQHQQQRPLSNATWPNLQETAGGFDRQQTKGQTSTNERPHTISSAYEKGGHQRPALSVYTFQAPDSTGCHSQPASPVSTTGTLSSQTRSQSKPTGKTANAPRPPIPNRCSSLERTTSASRVNNDGNGNQRPGKPKLPLPAHLAKELLGNQLVAQPMYVNMHELANLAANRAQEMQVPTVRSATASSSPNLIDKTESTIMPSPKDDKIQQTDSSNLDISGTCTLPRRGSFQQNKPVPPTRRTSTIITSSTSINTGTLEDNKNCSISISSSNLIEITTGSNDNERIEIQSIATDETENLPPPPAFLLEGNSPSASPSPPPQRSISVSETVRTLTELRHTPASPSFMRKLMTQQTQAATVTRAGRLPTEHSNSSRRVSTSSIESSSSGHSSSNTTTITVSNTSTFNSTQNLISVLSSKLSSTAINSTAGDCSPKLMRKHIKSAELQAPSSGPRRTSVGFLETLNAKLAAQKQQQTRQQHQQHQSQQQQQPVIPQVQTHLKSTGTLPGTNRSASVRRIMANRVPIIDPLQVRDSLMDQIRRGTSLRKTSGTINDRSAPQIY